MRLSITLAIALAVGLAARIPLPGLELLAGEAQVPRLLDSGLDSFVWAFLLVELVALLPALAHRRVGSLAERRPLTTAAMGLGVAFAVLSAAATETHLRGIALGESSLSTPPAWRFPALVLAPLALVICAWLVDRRGLGNGFALVFSALTLSDPLPTLGRTPSGELAMLALGAYALVAVAAARFTRWAGPNDGERPRWVPLPISGLAPLGFAVGALALPTVAASFFPGAEGAQQALVQIPGLYEGLQTLLVIDFTLLFGFLFARPLSVRALWERWLPSASGDVVQEVARRNLSRALAASALGMGLLALVATRLAANSAPISASLALEMGCAAVACADIADEWRARRKWGPLVRIAALHRIWEVEPVLARLERAGIDGHPRASRYRALLSFFGPYVPVEILVPAVQRSRAVEALSDPLEPVPAGGHTSGPDAPVPSHVPPPTAPAPAACAVHPDRPAQFTCARCGCFGCSQCRSGGGDVCSACFSRPADRLGASRRAKRSVLWGLLALHGLLPLSLVALWSVNRERRAIRELAAPRGGSAYIDAARWLALVALVGWSLFWAVQASRWLE